MSRIDSAFLRGSLASSGIFLDDPAPVMHRNVKPQNVPEPAPDRVAIRAALVEAGAPAQDLDWLTDSAPSLQAARAYCPSVWCITCADMAVIDVGGCVVCKQFKFTPGSEA